MGGGSVSRALRCRAMYVPPAELESFGGFWIPACAGVPAQRDDAG
ncbi:hypothetical protein SAMN05216212_0632 [Microbulbifer yueqingensis]|uniref:Uncharacterized protein n=1 Tax=Microbulbifer yueqingensis TaxID=658219 RepID=A0A1G8VM27_9GAMM|nr:hypothetical protein SAMN05216212_0632 [Microbulbifer yueqingensis]